jgi:hypothetical protein
MPTKRTRIARSFMPEISDEELFFLSDGLLASEPEKQSLKLFLLRGDDKALRALWDENKAAILEAWIRTNSGSRPALWWDFDAPRIFPESIALLGRGSTVVTLHRNDYCEPRKRLGGVGTPDFQELNNWPSFNYGIPSRWVSAWQESYYNGRALDIHGNRIGTEYEEGHFAGKAIRPNDPPRFESQASYLKRHGLFAPGEERRLHKDAFEPETILLPEEEI